MKTVIIEDEHLIAQEMKASLQGIAPDVEVLAVLPSIKAAKKWFAAHAEPDLLFMDIKLSDGLSFELFETVTVKCPIVFCTAYEEYAIRAFKVNGVDYLLKPVQEEDLKAAVDKVRNMLKGTATKPTDMEQLIQLFTQQLPAKTTFKERFIINSNNKWTPIEAKDIAVIYRDNLNYFYKFNGDKLIYDYSPLEEIEEVLNPEMFFRANRQTIIHIDAVQNVKPEVNQKMVVFLKPPLKLEVDVSREKAPLLKRWLDR